MTSSKERQQRAAARAKLARQMAERQAAAKRRRQRLIAAGASAGLLVVVVGTFLVVNAATGDDESTTPAANATPTGNATPSAPAAPGECAWTPEDPNRQGYDQLTDVGTPPPGAPREGISTMTIETNRGTIEVEMDRAKVPCTAASLTHLADQGFYDDTSCHRLVDEGIHVLQCGDPTGTGAGGPTYRFAEENLPSGESPAYPKGVVAMAKTSEAASTGSQFFIVYEGSDLPPEYTLLGTVTKGLDIVEEVAAGGHDGAYEQQAGGGVPNEELVIESLQVSDPS